MDNIIPILKWEIVDYIDIPFLDIISKLLAKDKLMVENGEIKYRNVAKDHKKYYPKKEEKNAYAIDNHENLYVDAP